MVFFVDCTLRDGGYYNDWEFRPDLINEYLAAMSAAGVDVVELGFRSLKNSGFKGPCAFTTDSFINSLEIPDGLIIGVMINGDELVENGADMEERLEALFPLTDDSTRVDLVRVACHVQDFHKVLPASEWLKGRGFKVGFNIMQIANRSQEEVEGLAASAKDWPLDVLYFADSMGGMDPQDTSLIIDWLRKHWDGELGIHTHDSMGMAMHNTMFALSAGVSWLDSTVTGMGRGPGNAQTEYLCIELGEMRGGCDLIPLLSLINRFFGPMQKEYGWGKNAFYHLAGKYGIHPTFIQRMVDDSRFSEEDILGVIEQLKISGGKSFKFEILEAARGFFRGEPRGTWSPMDLISGREVLILGTGPGVGRNSAALESYISNNSPLVIALNTQRDVDPSHIDVRIACHPLRLLADREEYVKFPHPLIAPVSMLPPGVTEALAGMTLFDYGIGMNVDGFEFYENHCSVPASMVMAYALAVTTSGKAERILLAGFDGYPGEDPRNSENNQIFQSYLSNEDALECISITPTRYNLEVQSVYGLIP